jgi:hypothetical protein
MDVSELNSMACKVSRKGSKTDILCYSYSVQLRQHVLQLESRAELLTEYSTRVVC